jgi:hypothetical protein
MTQSQSSPTEGIAAIEGALATIGHIRLGSGALYLTEVGSLSCDSSIAHFCIKIGEKGDVVHALL